MAVNLCLRSARQHICPCPVISLFCSVVFHFMYCPITLTHIIREALSSGHVITLKFLCFFIYKIGELSI
jgi:hypothetical protein